MSPQSADRKRVLVLAGPTAAGKTAVSLLLATRIRCEIVSADARQVYRAMDIGTAKPTHDELRSVPHHCIDVRDPRASYSAADFAADARAAIDGMPLNVLPIVVGGSGLYLTAALDGLSTDGTGTNDAIREEVKEELAARGRDAMYDELQRADPVAAARYADKNPRRIARALEFIRVTGRPFSSTWDAPRDAPPYHVLRVGIGQDRLVLQRRIDERCDRMWEQGLLDETRRLLEAGVDPHAQALQTVGYAEAISVLHGRSTESEALQAMKTATRRYAKRQMTWFRKDDRIVWINGSVEEMTDRVVDLLRDQGWWDDFVVLQRSNSGKSV